MTGREVLGQCSQQGVPAFVTARGRFVRQQRGLRLSLLPPVLLQELPDELPPGLVILRPRQVGSKISHSHGTVLSHLASSLSRKSPSSRRYCAAALPSLLA